VYDLCNALHGDVLEVPVAGLDENLDLCLEVCDHVHLAALRSALVCENVDEHTEVRVTHVVGVQELDEALEVLEVLLRDHVLVVDAVALILEQVVGLGAVHQFGVDLLHLRNVSVNVAQVLLDALELERIDPVQLRVGGVPEEFGDTLVEELLIGLELLVVVHGGELEGDVLALELVQDRVGTQLHQPQLVVDGLLLLP